MKRNTAEKLDILLKKISPTMTIDKNDRFMDQATNRFRYGTSAVRNRKDFQVYFARFYCYLENISFKRNRNLNEKFDFHRCIQVFRDTYGLKGEHVAFEIALTGVDGGIYSLMKLIAKKTSEKYSRNQIRAIVDKFLSHLSFDETLSVAGEYKRKFGRFLPFSYANGSVALLAANLQKILEEHPFMIKRMRQVVR